MSNLPHDHLFKLRHTVAHLLAAAVQELYPMPSAPSGRSLRTVSITILTLNAHWRVISRLLKKMRDIAKTWKGCERSEMSPEDAKAFFKDNEYKRELIDGFAGAGESIHLHHVHSTTCAKARTWRIQPGNSRTSNCCHWRARTGAGTKKIRCSRAFTARRF